MLVAIKPGFYSTRVYSYLVYYKKIEDTESLQTELRAWNVNYDIESGSFHNFLLINIDNNNSTIEDVLQENCDVVIEYYATFMCFLCKQEKHIDMFVRALQTPNNTMCKYYSSDGYYTSAFISQEERNEIIKGVLKQVFMKIMK